MSAPIVRFAPSPTGWMHVGNLRTALMNQLFARRHDGKFLLRIDDTDLERSKPEYEQGIDDALDWMGFQVHSRFRQSERFDLYAAAAERLKADGRLYPCYETEEELERKRKLQLARGRPPVYDRAALKLTQEERAKLEAEGRKPHWRFRLTGARVAWTDLVRGPVEIDTASLSDPILVREDGSYLYTLPSVVDDIDAKITHVVRGEDHTTNSGAQIEIFEALGASAPQMAHTPLLVGADGDKLSKRLGSLGVREFRAQGYEPMALASLLAKLGTSDPVEPRADLDALAAEFDFAKIGRAPARFDEADVRRLNAALLSTKGYADVEDRLAALGVGGDEAFWLAVRENLETLNDAVDWWGVVTGPVAIPDEVEDAFLAAALDCLPDGALDGTSWTAFTDAVKAKTGAKGRALFRPLRLALTGREHGPEMAALFPLIGASAVRARLARETV